MKQEKNPKSNSLKPAAPLLLHLELINSWSTREETQLLMEYAGATRRGTITRDILIPAEMTLHQLHYAIQRLFGWQNAHLRAFRLDEKDYDRLTQKRFREWSELAGVLFRGIVNDFEDQFWDDDYSGGNLKTWLRKKYTGPAVDGSYTEDFEIAQGSVQQLIQRFPEIDVKEPFHDYYERIKDHKDRHEEKLQTIRTAPIRDLTIAELETAISFDSGFDELLERLPE